VCETGAGAGEGLEATVLGFSQGLFALPDEQAPPKKGESDESQGDGECCGKKEADGERRLAGARLE
jgi:hypothetical protein